MAAKTKVVPIKQGGFDDVVEQAVRRQLALPIAEKPGDTGVTFDEYSKAVANAIRWAAVKNKLVTGEHGSGFEED